MPVRGMRCGELQGRGGQRLLRAVRRRHVLGTCCFCLYSVSPQLVGSGGKCFRRVCLCNPGFYQHIGACTQCAIGRYKATVSNEPCTP